MNFTIDQIAALNFPNNWVAIDVDKRPFPQLELAREICATHQLANTRVTAIANGGNGDDFLFFVHTDPPTLALVHLTFRKTRETSPLWPATSIHHTIDSLLKEMEEV